jgi:integrase
MREARTGTVTARRRRGRTLWVARVLLQDGSRKELTCPYGLNREESEARARAWQISEDETSALYLERKKRAGVALGGEPADAWFSRMLPIRASAKKTVDANELESYWRTWIAPVLGKKPMVTLNRADAIAVTKALEAAISAGRIRSKTAVNIWSTFKTACKIACSDRGWCEPLKVRDDDPTLGIGGPEHGPSRKRQWLYPNEFAALMACDAVPVDRRRLYSFAAYTGVRPGELAELRFKDIDLAGSVLRVSRALKIKVKRIGSTKTDGGVREVPLEPALVPTLLTGEAEELLFPHLATDRHYSPDTFRDDLKTAGVTSTRLWTETETHLRVDFRCLRDTYATWQCLAGLDIHKLMRRMGHAKIDQTLAYVKAAETVHNVGTPFAELPLSAKGCDSGCGSEHISLESRASRRIRTYDLRLRRPTLYPTELATRTLTELHELAARVQPQLEERKGFEPSVPLLVHSISNAAPSTTRPPLLESPLAYQVSTRMKTPHSARFLIALANLFNAFASCRRNSEGSVSSSSMSMGAPLSSSAKSTRA